VGSTTSKARVNRSVALLGLTGALFATTSGSIFAESGTRAAAAGLQGAWAVQVTLRDCTTGDRLGSFPSLVSFHRGGTISEDAGSLAFAAGQRSSGHGTWSRRAGNKYRQRMLALILFDTEPNLPGSPGFDPSRPVSPGFFAGWATVTHTVTLAGDGDFTSAGTNQFYKTDGSVYRSGCSTAIGQRFE
jgi:hypothetical protein